MNDFQINDEVITKSGIPGRIIAVGENPMGKIYRIDFTHRADGEADFWENEIRHMQTSDFAMVAGFIKSKESNTQADFIKKHILKQSIWPFSTPDPVDPVADQTQNTPDPLRRSWIILDPNNPSENIVIGEPNVAATDIAAELGVDLTATRDGNFYNDLPIGFIEHGEAIPLYSHYQEYIRHVQAEYDRLYRETDNSDRAAAAESDSEQWFLAKTDSNDSWNLISTENS